MGRILKERLRKWVRETIRRYIEQQEWKEIFRYGRIKAKGERNYR